jgi:hypothetical protein
MGSAMRNMAGIRNAASASAHYMRSPGGSATLVGIATAILIIAFSGPVTCRDGWQSPSIGRRGACSHHGGVGSGPMLPALFGGGTVGYGIFLFRMRRRAARPTVKILFQRDPHVTAIKEIVEREARCPICASQMQLRLVPEQEMVISCARHPYCKGNRFLTEFLRDNPRVLRRSPIKPQMRGSQGEDRAALVHPPPWEPVRTSSIVGSAKQTLFGNRMARLNRTLGPIGFVIQLLGFFSFIPAGVLHFTGHDPHDIAVMIASGLFLVGGLLFGRAMEQAAKEYRPRHLTTRQRALMPRTPDSQTGA